MLHFPSHLRGGGVGTLVEPAKYEPSETACRMADGGNFINCHSELVSESP